MVVIVLRSRLRPEAAGDELAEMGQRMYSLAARMPGFLSYKDFVADDGENVSIVEFDTLEALAAWREHLEHRVAQARGRAEFFSEYRIQVWSVVREYSFRPDEPR